jgi:hypothetical protein
MSRHESEVDVLGVEVKYRYCYDIHSPSLVLETGLGVLSYVSVWAWHVGRHCDTYHRRMIERLPEPTAYMV